jgi:hypothetical protein
MTSIPGVPSNLSEHPNLRRWISRAFIVSILVYFVVIGYLVAESVRGASRWAPYGVNMPVFVSLIIASEIVITLSAIWIFREDTGIWPASVAFGWKELRSGSVGGLGRLLGGAWDVSIVDLRLRTTRAIALGRVNRLAALLPLVYALAASASSGAPWGLRASAMVDVGLTLAVWAFMEAVMVRPDTAGSRVRVEAAPARQKAAGKKASRYEVRRVDRTDIPRIEEIEHIKWRDQAATRDLIQQRLTRYPQGQVAAVHVSLVDGEVAERTVVAWCTVMPAREEQVRAFRSWDAVTSNGTISGCDPKGNVLVGVNLTSVTEGATYMLLGEILASVVAWGKTKMIGGGRLTGFVSFNEHRAHEGKAPLAADQYARLREVRGHRLNERRLDDGQPPLSDDAYVALLNSLNAVNGREPLDPAERPDFICSNVRGYMSIPGARMVEVAPNYFPDSASDNWGVVIDWTNPLPAPLRGLPVLRTFVASRIRKEVREEWEARKRRVHEASVLRAMHRAPAREPEPVLV